MAQSLAEASRKERAVVDNAQDVICLINSVDKFVNVNPACNKVWGYEPSELMGLRLAEIVVSDDVEDTLKAIAATKTGSNTVSFENRIKHKLGREVCTLWSVNWSQQEQSLFCVAHDITDRKLAEARIRSLIDNMPVGLVVVDENCLIEAVNPKSEELFDCPQAELVGKNLMQLLAINNTASPDSFLASIRKSPASPASQLPYRRKTGEEIYVELSLREFETAAGNRNLVSIHDVTERRRMETLKQEFVAMITHDLRTPLASIQFTLELFSRMEAAKLSDEWKARLSGIENGCTRLLQLINNLLDLEKIRSGKLDLDLEVHQLDRLIDCSIDAVRGFAEQNGIELKGQSLATVVVADEERIVQVLVNLLANAIKFSPAGQSVIVESELLEDVAEIRVVDHGRGIPEAKLEQIFDRFTQVSNADAQVKGGGTGLGLTICKAIIEAHQGSIGVRSQEGKGSTFWFRIPLA